MAEITAVTDATCGQADIPTFYFVDREGSGHSLGPALLGNSFVCFSQWPAVPPPLRCVFRSQPSRQSTSYLWKKLFSFFHDIFHIGLWLFQQCKSLKKSSGSCKPSNLCIVSVFPFIFLCNLAMSFRASCHSWNICQMQSIVANTHN